MRSTTSHVVCILGMALTAAVLVLTVPSLVGGSGETGPLVAGVSALAFAGFAVAARRTVPDRSGPPSSWLP